MPFISKKFMKLANPLNIHCFLSLKYATRFFVFLDCVFIEPRDTLTRINKKYICLLLNTDLSLNQIPFSLCFLFSSSSSLRWSEDQKQDKEINKEYMKQIAYIFNCDVLLPENFSDIKSRTGPKQRYRLEYIEYHFGKQVNPEIFLIDKSQADEKYKLHEEKEFLAMKKHFEEVYFPAFIRELEEDVLQIFDSDTLIEYFHSRGVNIKLLGRIAK